jgi:hypothetical protein
MKRRDRELATIKEEEQTERIKKWFSGLIQPLLFSAFDKLS